MDLCQLLADNNFLVAGNEEFHDGPAYEVGNATDAKYDEVACGFAFVAHKRHVGLGCIIEEHTGTEVYEE